MTTTVDSARGRLSPPVLLLIAAALGSAALLAALQSHFTFFLDEWDLLLHRRGFSADAFLRPHNEHIIVAPAIVYKAIQGTLGMESPAPYQAIAIATFVASAVLLFVWVRRRIGEWPALLAAVLILFLGAAYEDLLSAFQIGYFGSMAFGLAALLALEDPGRRNDLIACAGLVIACSFSSVGLPFAVGAAVVIATEPGRLRRIWIVAVPVALFALWWIGWGSEADSTITFESIAEAPGYVLAGLANGISALLGLAPSSGTFEGGALGWGRPLLLVAAALVAWRAHRLGGGSRWLWAAAAMLLTFWVLAAVNAALFRPPTSARYTYVGGVFTLMIAAELLRGVRLSRSALVAGFAIGALAIGANLITLRDGYRTLEQLTSNERGGLTAIELARDTVAADFLLTQQNSDAPFFDYVDASSYLSAVDAFGSPAYTEEELLAADESDRIAADKAISEALRLGLEPAPRACPPAGADVPATTAVEVGPGTVAIRAGPDGATVRARRFAAGSYPVELGRLDPGRSAVLTIPRDRAATTWKLELAGAEACPPA